MKWAGAFLFIAFSFCLNAQSSLLQQMELVFKKGQLDGASELLDRAIEEAIAQGDSATLGKAYFFYAEYYSKHRSFVDQKLNSPKAYEYATKALQILRQSNDVSGIADTKLLLGRLSDRMKDFDEAFSLYKQALEDYKTVNDTAGICKAYVRMGQHYRWINKDFYDIHLAVTYYEEAIRYALLLGEESMLAYVYLNAASALLQKGYEEQSYLHKGLEAALFSKAYYLKIDPDGFNYILSYVNEGYAYEALGQYDKAESVARSVLAGEIDWLTRSECYRLLYRTFKASGKLDSALINYEKYKLFEDSVEYKGIQDKLLRLEKEFEMQEKQSELNRLEQQSTIDQLQIRSKNQVLTIAISALIIIVISVALWYQRNAAAKNKMLLAVEQKLLRLQMNPHFIFNALAVIQGTLDSGQKNEASMYLSSFSKLMRDTLEFSREDFITLEEEETLLKNYIKIQQLSSGKKVNYEILIDDTLDPFETVVPPMFAQPFVENALMHSGITESEKGKLTVRFLKKEDRLALEVVDNGGGFEASRAVEGHKSLSLQITKERLELLSAAFKKELKLIINSGEDGTAVQLELPLV